MTADDFDLEPLFATSIIHVSQPGNGLIEFSQVLAYDYADKTRDRSYFETIKDSSDFLPNEMVEIEANMQQFLDEEENVVNGVRVYPHVASTAIDFKTDRRQFVYTWIISFSGPESAEGMEVYEARIVPTDLEYDVKSTYIFPANARVVEVVSSIETKNDLKNVVGFRGKKGEHLDHVERLSWILE
jgi:hypothetical protein